MEHNRVINFKEWSGASSHRGDLFTCDIAGTEGYQTVHWRWLMTWLSVCPPKPEKNNKQPNRIVTQA